MFEDNEPPVYCPNCGSIVDAGASFCDVCGARIPPDASAAAPTREMPTVVPPPQVASQPQASAQGGRNPALAFGMGVLLLAVLAVGAVLALNLRGGGTSDESGGPGPVGGSEQRNAGASEASNDAEEPEDPAAGVDNPEPSTPEAEPSTPEPAAQSEAEVAEATEDYYQAVDREDWAYTYANLDSQTRALYTEDEWYAKNQYFADTEGLELATIDVTVNGSASEPVVPVTVYRTFKDGTSITRDTLFVLEDGVWKHRFTDEENAIFMPGVPYEEFVAYQ